jgi:hypothetical protein
MRMREAVTETMKAATEIIVVMMKMARINHSLRSKLASSAFIFYL